MAPRMVRSASREAGRPRSNSISGVVAMLDSSLGRKGVAGEPVNPEENGVPPVKNAFTRLMLMALGADERLSLKETFPEVDVLMHFRNLLMAMCVFAASAAPGVV